MNSTKNDLTILLEEGGCLNMTKNCTLYFNPNFCLGLFFKWRSWKMLSTGFIYLKWHFVNENWHQMVVFRWKYHFIDFIINNDMSLFHANIIKGRFTYKSIDFFYRPWTTKWRKNRQIWSKMFNFTNSR